MCITNLGTPVRLDEGWKISQPYRYDGLSCSLSPLIYIPRLELAMRNYQPKTIRTTQYNMVALTPTLIDRIRSNRFIWSVRFLQGIFAIAILGICASNASTWAEIGCSTPSRLAYHIAAVGNPFFPSSPEHHMTRLRA